MSKNVVIVGGGHGGFQVVASLVEAGFEGQISLISEETNFPYQRPPLSKGFLTGKQSEASLAFRNAVFYEKSNIQLDLGLKVSRIDVENKVLSTYDAGDFEYDYLVLATGARNRLLPNSLFDNSQLTTPNSQLTEGVFYLRDLHDAEILKAKLETVEQITVIGGGFIGLEVAAAAVELGKKVTVIEAQERLMQRVLPPIVSDVFYKKHRGNGVNILLNSKIEKITQNTEGGVFELKIKNSELTPNSQLITHNSQLIVVGIGVLPNSELAERAGLKCENGIVINEFCQTSDPSVPPTDGISQSSIFAIGDCAQHFNPYAGKWTRLESVQNAVDQAKTVAQFILGNPQPYNSVPYFWTHQYDLKLQMAGFSEGFDRFVLRGSIEAQKFSVFYFKEDKLIGVDSLNRPTDHLAARRLLERGIAPTNEQIEDIGFKWT